MEDKIVEKTEIELSNGKGTEEEEKAEG